MFLYFFLSVKTYSNRLHIINIWLLKCNYNVKYSSVIYGAHTFYLLSVHFFLYVILNKSLSY